MNTRPAYVMILHPDSDPYFVSFNQGIIMQRNKTYADKRTFLRIKLRSLAEEARIIRSVEHKHRDISQLNEMHQHRTLQLRTESRHTHLAYGLMRGLKWSDMEHNWAQQEEQRQPDWHYVQRMLDKYGKKGSMIFKSADGDRVLAEIAFAKVEAAVAA